MPFNKEIVLTKGGKHEKVNLVVLMKMHRDKRILSGRKQVENISEKRKQL